MAYGRPMMIHSRSTRSFVLPSMVDDDLLTPNYKATTRSPTKRSKIAFYVQSLKLILILGEILESFYSQDSDQNVTTDGEGGNHRHFRSKTGDTYQNQNPSPIDSERLQKLLRIDAALVHWQKGLPSHLLVDIDGLEQDLGEGRPSSQSTASSLFKRQARILRAR